MTNSLRALLISHAEKRVVRFCGKLAYKFIAYLYSLFLFLIPGVQSVYAKGSWADRSFAIGYSDIDLAILIDHRRTFCVINLAGWLKQIFNFLVPVIGEIEIVNQHLVNLPTFSTYRQYYSWRPIWGKKPRGLEQQCHRQFDLDLLVFTYAYHLCQSYVYSRNKEVFLRQARRYLKGLQPFEDAVLCHFTAEELMRLCHNKLEEKIASTQPALSKVNDLSPLFFSAILPFLPPTLRRCNNLITIDHLPKFGLFPAIQCRYSHDVVTTHPIFVGQVLASYIEDRNQSTNSQGILFTTIFTQWRGVLLNGFPFQPPNQDDILTLWGWLEFASGKLPEVDVQTKDLTKKVLIEGFLALEKRYLETEQLGMI